MRYTTYHCGKAVIKDKSKLSEAMRKLAKLEDEEGLRTNFEETSKWIPTTERLPDQREFIEAYIRHEYAAEFLVMIEGANRATTLYYSQTGVWFDEQRELYKVEAWMPLPEPYKEDN